MGSVGTWDISRYIFGKIKNKGKNNVIHRSHFYVIAAYDCTFITQALAG